MKIYDITLPLSDTLPMWPGDEPYQYTMRWKIADGASVNLGSLCLSAHAGTHADAPLHYKDGAAGIAEMALDPFIGPALVVDVRGLPTIRVEDVAVEGLAGNPRVLLKTGAWTDPDRFPETFPVMEAEVPAFLHRHGVVLVGVDIPSVDAFDSKDLPIHHALHDLGICILESLSLADAPAGRYELIALPLRLVGADGSPVRAVLRSLPQ